MNIKKLERRIKKMKAELSTAKSGGAESLSLRTERKRLKRAQRKRKVRLAMLEKVKAQGRKKEESDA